MPPWSQLNIPLEEFLRPFFGPGERICLRIFDDRKTGTFKGAKRAAKAIAAVMGVEAEEVLPMTAVVCCRGDCDHTHKKYVYQGLNSCQGAKQFYGGEGECVYGCLGHGDCMNVCPNGAIRIENGIAQIDPYICTGCGICAKVCPNQVIHVVPSASTIAAASPTR